MLAIVLYDTIVLKRSVLVCIALVQLDGSRLTFEGDLLVGPASIVQKLTVSFNTLQKVAVTFFVGTAATS